MAMCPLVRMPFRGCRASSGHHNLFSTGPRGQWIFYFFLVRKKNLFLLGIGKTRKATLIRTYFSLYIGLMYNFTCEIINSRRENICVITCFKGGQWVFGGASGFSDSLAPRASGCHSPMSRPVIYIIFLVCKLLVSYAIHIVLSLGSTTFLNLVPVAGEPALRQQQ